MDRNPARNQVNTKTRKLKSLTVGPLHVFLKKKDLFFYFLEFRSQEKSVLLFIMAAQPLENTDWRRHLGSLERRVPGAGSVW